MILRLRLCEPKQAAWLIDVIARLGSLPEAN